MIENINIIRKEVGEQFDDVSYVGTEPSTIDKNIIAKLSSEYDNKYMGSFETICIYVEEGLYSPRVDGDKSIYLFLPSGYIGRKYIIRDDGRYRLFDVCIQLSHRNDNYYDIVIHFTYGYKNPYLVEECIIRIDCSYYNFEESLRNIIDNYYDIIK